MNVKFVEIKYDYKNRFGIVISDKMDIPYIHDGCGCKNYNQAETNLEVNSWPTFEGYLVFELPSGDISVKAINAIEEVKINDDFEGQMTSCSIFDNATSGMRYHLTLLNIKENLKIK